MNPDELIFDKNYVPICTTWLNLKPFTQKSRIEEQLRSLDDLVERRLLRAWKIIKGKEGQWKVIAYPGTGFFADYENMYRRKGPTREPQQVEPEPLMFLRDFHKQLGREQEEFAPKEVSYVRSLLSRYGQDGLREFMSFGLAEANKTKFDMQWFGALSLYEGKWQATHQKKRKIQERQAATAACCACNDVGMLEFEDGTVGHCPHEVQKLSRIHTQKPIRGFSPA
jgi:hypothetical protein